MWSISHLVHLYSYTNQQISCVCGAECFINQRSEKKIEKSLFTTSVTSSTLQILTNENEEDSKVWKQQLSEEKYEGLQQRSSQRQNSLLTTPDQALISLLWLLSGWTGKRARGEDRRKKSDRGKKKNSVDCGFEIEDIEGGGGGGIKQAWYISWLCSAPSIIPEFHT